MTIDTGPSFSTTARPERERVGPFELERLLGRGGMAETFVAVRRGPGGFEQRVCLKRILPQLASDPNMVRLFLDEARNTASLRHSNIVQVIDFGTSGDHHYLALELVDGIDLQRLLELQPEGQRGFPAELVAHIAVELSTALSYAHNAPNLAGQNGIFHRDLSPSNILVSETGDLKLTDFGVAKAAGQARATAAGIVRGKVEYMAPEYGMGGDYDARCDQYALGVLLFELLAGVRPYVGNSQGEVLHRARQGFHRPLTTLRSDVPVQLIDAIDRMIRPKPEQRFESMAEVTKALLDIAPGPRGRAALAERIAIARGKAPAPKSSARDVAFDPLAQTMMSPPSQPAPGVPSERPVAVPKSDPPNGVLRKNASPSNTEITVAGARPMSRVWIAVALAVLLLLLIGVRALMSPNAADVSRPAAIKVAPTTIHNAPANVPPTTVAPVEPELPVGVEPPLPLEPSPDDATEAPPPGRAPTASPRAPEKTPPELIHRQKQDLLKPKDW